jgi:hypothetical protein
MVVDEPKSAIRNPQSKDRADVVALLFNSTREWLPAIPAKHGTESRAARLHPEMGARRSRVGRGGAVARSCSVPAIQCSVLRKDNRKQ